MRIKAKDFGPIHNIDVELKPMTILIGKNNLGKSFFAQLAYVLLNILNETPFKTHYYRWMGPIGELVPIEVSMKRLVLLIKKERLSQTQIVDEVAQIALSYSEILVGRTLKLELERAFGPEISNVININASSATIECDALRYVTLRFELKRREQIKVSFQISRETIEYMAAKHSETVQKILQRRQKLRYVEILFSELQEDLMTLREELRQVEPRLLRIMTARALRVGRPVPRAYYIPAGRGGLVESFDTVVDSLFYDAAMAPARGISMAPLPGMASQFYLVLRGLEGNKGPLGKQVTNLFKEILGGDIRLRPVKLRRGLKPLRTRMIYRYQLGKKTSTIDLIRAASMIKEIAPIYLVVQELVHPGQFLIIEEPESHLHPGAQSKLIRILATLTKSKVNVLLTTHSTIIIRKISHFLGRLPNESSSFIDHQSVALYWLKEGKYGSTSKPLKISKRGILDGIPTFDEAINELYDEEEALSREVEAEGKEAGGRN
jgi:predicted ATPase